jgi:allantoinase
MYDLLVKNGKIVKSNLVFNGSVAVNQGKIVAILPSDTDAEAKTVIDAGGKYVLPGGIDSHAHLNDPGYCWREDYDHGTAAAAVGGLTTIVDMPLQNEPAMTDGKIMDTKEAAVSPKAYVDYCFWGGLTDYNFDSLKELDEKGCVAFKSFIGPVSPDYVSLSYGQAREALEIIKSFDGRAGFHCEDYSLIKWGEHRAIRDGNIHSWRAFLDSRPVVSEALATEGIIMLSEETGCKVHICHVSHPYVAELIRQAQKKGINVTAETCSHYLTFTEDDVIRNGAIFKCAPPLRKAEDRDKLWEYVLDGTLSCVGSDHSPCREDEKAEGENGVFSVWGGISGIQNVMQSVYSEGVGKRGYDVTLLARCLSEGPAKTFGIYGKKGALEVGFDADIVVLDPEKEWEVTPNSLLYLNKISAFIGLKGKGLPVCTICRGEVVAENGKIVGKKGFGQLVKKIK